MHYNPCGRAVDISTHPYRTTCRFWTGTDLLGTIQWVPCGPKPRSLGEFSGIVNLDWESDRELWQQELGEQWGAPRPYSAGHVPPGIGDHVCGPPDWFTFGEPFDGTRPNTQYGGLGWPVCCNPPPLLRGPAGASGHMVPSFVTPDAPAGGIRIGGYILNYQSNENPLQKGSKIGGFVIDNNGGANPTPGGTAIGGFVLNQFVTPDAPAGGARVGGFVLDVAGTADAPAGGARVGGFVLDVAGTVDAPAGGIKIGGQVLNLAGTVDAPAGGIKIGGLIADKTGTSDATAGGIKIGGAISDTFTPGGPANTTGTGTTVTLPPNTSGGGLLILFVASGDASVTTPGWTVVQSITQSAGIGATLSEWKHSASGSTTVALSDNASWACWYLTSHTTFDAFSQSDVSGSPVKSGRPFTSNQPDAEVVAWLVGGSGQTITPTAGATVTALQSNTYWGLTFRSGYILTSNTGFVPDQSATTSSSALSNVGLSDCYH